MISEPVVLVMTVVSGFGGQQFMPEVLPKPCQIKERFGKHPRLEIHRGVRGQTLGL